MLFDSLKVITNARSVPLIVALHAELLQLSNFSTLRQEEKEITI